MPQNSPILPTTSPMPLPLTCLPSPPPPPQLLQPATAPQNWRHPRPAVRPSRRLAGGWRRRVRRNESWMARTRSRLFVSIASISLFKHSRPSLSKSCSRPHCYFWTRGCGGSGGLGGGRRVCGGRIVLGRRVWGRCPPLPAAAHPAPSGFDGRVCPHSHREVTE